MDDQIEQIRKSYASGELDEEGAGRSPFALFREWMQAAIDAGISEPNGMTLATATPDGEPSARIVLLRGYDERGFVFYTNYESAKARDMLVNPRAALTFWWRELDRQVRIGGRVEKVSRAESESYFQSRPRGHQLGAWASPQSHPVRGREELETREADAAALFPATVPLPDFWGGYRVSPERMEFWQGRENRLHDRFLFEMRRGEWLVSRLAP